MGIMPLLGTMGSKWLSDLQAITGSLNTTVTYLAASFESSLQYVASPEPSPSCWKGEVNMFRNGYLVFHPQNRTIPCFKQEDTP